VDAQTPFRTVLELQYTANQSAFSTHYFLVGEEKTLTTENEVQAFLANTSLHWSPLDPRNLLARLRRPNTVETPKGLHPEPPRYDLAVAVSLTGLLVVAHPPLLPEMRSLACPKEACEALADYDTAGLAALLGSLKEAQPQATEVLLVADPMISFETVLHIVNTMRSIFPRIALSNEPPEPQGHAGDDERQGLGGGADGESAQDQRLTVGSRTTNR